MAKRQGKYTLLLPSKPSFIGYAAVGGKAEGEGPLAEEFDKTYKDDSIDGCPSWEKAESALQRDAITRAIDKAGLSPKNIDLIMAGDLLNQCIGTSFGIRDFDVAFMGMYGACSTMALSMATASVLVDAGALNNAVAATSSHFASAERQFRFPLEYGGQRPPAAQRTATAAGAAVISGNRKGMPCAEAVIFGKIKDLGIKDANNMGAAMAPAAAKTIKKYLDDIGKSPQDFDVILTGDLGIVGSKLLKELLEKENIDISGVHKDCGTLIFDPENQDTHAGGSGCGCGASVLCGYFLPRLMTGEIKEMIFAATGALMSPTASQQGESIPSISHLVHLSHERKN